MSDFLVRGRFSRLPDIFVPAWLHIPTSSAVKEEEEEKEGEEGKGSGEKRGEEDGDGLKEGPVSVTVVFDTRHSLKKNSALDSKLEVPMGNLKKSSFTPIGGNETGADAGGGGGGGSGSRRESPSPTNLIEEDGRTSAKGGGSGSLIQAVYEPTGRSTSTASNLKHGPSNEFRNTILLLNSILEEQREPAPRGRNPLELQRAMAELLRISNADADLDDAIALDVFVAATRWAADASFDALQTALFLHLLQRLHIQIEENPTLENLMTTLHGHVYNEAFFEQFREAQIVDMIDYIAEAVLKPFRLYRLYSLISFVHEGADNPEIIKKSGKSVHDVFLRYDVTASVVVPDTSVLPAPTSPPLSPSRPDVNNALNAVDNNALNAVDNNALNAVDNNALYFVDNTALNASNISLGNDEGVGPNWNANAHLDPQNLERRPQRSATSIASFKSFHSGSGRRRSSNRKSNSSVNQETSGNETPPPLPPKIIIPPLCEAIPMELYLKNKKMEEEAERVRREEEERYALLHPKILTSAEELNQMLETFPAQEMVDLVSSRVASRVKEVGQTLQDDLKRQENVWDEKLEAVDTKLKEQAEGGGGGKGAALDNKSVKSQKTAKSEKSKKSKKK